MINAYGAILPRVHPTAFVHDSAHCLIGIGAIVLDGVELGEERLVAAGALVAPGTTAPPRSVLMGSPAKIVREIREDDRELIRRSARNYLALKNDYKETPA